MFYEKSSLCVCVCEREKGARGGAGNVQREHFLPDNTAFFTELSNSTATNRVLKNSWKITLGVTQADLRRWRELSTNKNTHTLTHRFSHNVRLQTAVVSQPSSNYRSNYGVNKPAWCLQDCLTTEPLLEGTNNDGGATCYKFMENKTELLTTQYCLKVCDWYIYGALSQH